MSVLKYVLSGACFALFASVAGMVLYDIYLAYELDRLLERRQKSAEEPKARAAGPVAAASLRPNLKL